MMLGDAVEGELAGAPWLRVVTQRVFQYDHHHLVFYERDGVRAVLLPGTLGLDRGQLLAVVPPGGGEGELDEPRWLGLLRRALRISGAPPAADELREARGLIVLDLGPLLHAELLGRVVGGGRPPEPEQARILGLLDVLAHWRSQGRDDLEPGQVLPTYANASEGMRSWAMASGPPGLDQPGWEPRDDGVVLRGVVHKREGIDGWTGERRRVSLAELFVDADGWRFVATTLGQEEDLGQALT